MRASFSVDGKPARDQAKFPTDAFPSDLLVKHDLSPGEMERVTQATKSFLESTWLSKYRYRPPSSDDKSE